MYNPRKMRGERKIGIVITALAVACSREPRTSQPSISLPPTESVPKVEPLATQAPSPEPTPQVEFMPLSETSESIQNQSGTNFLNILDQIETHQDEKISAIAMQTRLAQEKGVVFYTSIPILDKLGNLVDTSAAGTPAIICSYEKDQFLITINSNVYYHSEATSPEATAALIDECFNFQEGVNQRYHDFKVTNPGITLSEALESNPQWIDEASIEAWYLTTGNIIAPYRNKMPTSDKLLATLILIHDRCRIDFAQHEMNPAKALQDKKCWQQNFNRFKEVLA